MTPLLSQNSAEAPPPLCLRFIHNTRTRAQHLHVTPELLVTAYMRYTDIVYALTVHLKDTWILVAYSG
eukprot:1334567-Amorphochlora_amoeboformis.AAC.1